jgi:hypothetical protein
VLELILIDDRQIIQVEYAALRTKIDKIAPWNLQQEQ